MINLHLFNHRDVARLLPMDRCISLMEEVMLALEKGRATLPLRSITWMKDRSGALGLMPAILDRPAVMGVKVISVFPGNSGTALESHQGAILLFEMEHGRPYALVDAAAVTAVRTAAVSAAATRILSREDAGQMALLGSGVQAETHLEAILSVRPLKKVRVFSRTASHAQAFARRASAKYDVEVAVAASAREAVSGAAILCTVTGSAEPLVLGEWLAPGAHINAVGACTPAARDLDGAAMARARIFTDRRESALAEAGDLLLAMQEKAIGADPVAGELGELLAGTVPGRTGPDQITLFESLGLAVQDLAAAHEVFTRGRRKGAGTAIPWGGERYAAS
ncbi:MAG: ornithine cyclodeaminase family protein [Acidobacteriota bacterium]